MRTMIMIVELREGVVYSMTNAINSDTTVTVNFKEGVIDSLKPTLESWRASLKSRSRKVPKKEDTEDSNSDVE